MADNDVLINRIVAVIIDSVILFVVMAVISIPFGLSAAMFSMMSGVTDPMAWTTMMFMSSTLSIISFILGLLYFSYFESSSGQTPGKKLLGVKVVKEGGGKVTFGDAIIRNLLRIIDGIAFYLIGFILILVTEKKQRIGDIVAKTLVVKA